MNDVLVREDGPKTWVDANGTIHIDRRRPGRREDVDPSLVPLLRGEAPIVADLVEVEHDNELTVWPSRDDMNFAVAICYGLGLSALFWTGLVYLILR